MRILIGFPSVSVDAHTHTHTHIYDAVKDEGVTPLAAIFPQNRTKTFMHTAEWL